MSKIALRAVRQNGCSLRYVKEQTEGMCLESVRNSGLALKFVVVQTEEICLEAVRNRGGVLKFVENPLMKQRVMEKLNIKD